MFTENKEPINIMYVFVRSDLSYVHMAVQAGHALAAFMLEHSLIYKGTMWTNGTLVYLNGKDEKHLQEIIELFEATGRKFSVFIEPDWEGGPQKTAIATIATRGEFEGYRTIKMPKGFFPKIRGKLMHLLHKLPVTYPFR